MALPQYRTVAEVAEATGYTQPIVREAIAAGELKATRPKDHTPWRIREPDVIAWIERLSNEQPADVAPARAS